MKILKDIRKYDFVGVIGDLHLDFSFINNFIIRMKMSNFALICVGDFTVGSGPVHLRAKRQRFIKEFNKFLANNDAVLYSIRGNHDNPKYFDGKHNLSNIIYLPDFTLLEIHDRKVFCLGGAHSIDRKHRTKNVSWWSAEVINFDESEIEALGVDTMITHAAPYGVYPYQTGFLVDKYSNDETYFDKKLGKEVTIEGDYHLKTDLHIERNLLRKYFNEVKEMNPTLSKYFYGHYHQSAKTELEGVNFMALAIGEIVEL